ncbi:MAG TPA: Ig-like domain-containing protein [Spirochaetota bacterium]|nr:Ig-like domain-containing protein [Spirochaetota bacterium]
MKNQLHRGIIAYLLILVITAIASCTREAATLNPMSVTATGGGGAVGTDNPQIYAVFPGRLTSHSGSPGVMTGITPGDTANDITIVFTRVMDNASVISAIHVYVGAAGSTSAVFTVNTTNSQSYAVDVTGGLAASTTYRVVIDNTAYLSGDPSLNLDFSNLTAHYAGSLTDVTVATPLINDVEFQLITNASGAASDTSAPTLSVTNPADASTGVPIRLTGSNGRIEFTFSEAVDPTTVTGTSITLTGATAGNVTGTVGRIDETNLNFFFLPGSELDYEDTYTLTVSVGNAIEDYAGNPLVQDTISFSTPLYSTVPASINTGSVYVEYDPGNPTQVTIHWTTDIKSVSHAEIDDAEAFASAVETYHSTALVYNHSYTFTGLDRNQVYSFSISTNSDPATLTGGPFNQTLSFNAVIRTTPDASDNYQLAVNGSDETGLKSCQLNVNQSFLIWKSGTSVYAQYFDSSSGMADTWDRWAASGVSLFTAGGIIGIISVETTTGVIVSGVNGGDIYASRIYDSAGIAYTWGSGGLQVYDGSAVNARMALTNSVYVTPVTSGIAETNFIYDSVKIFSVMGALDSGDHMINEAILAGASGHTTVSEIYGDNMLLLASDRITSSNFNYRIGDAGTTETATANWSASGTTMTVTNGNLDANDIVTGDSKYTYIISYDDEPFTGYFNYTTALATGFVIGNSLTTYDLITNGTADTNALYDLSRDFSAAGVTTKDIVINTVTGDYDLADTVYADNHDLLILSDGARFLFDTAQAYSIFRLPTYNHYVTCGTKTTATGSVVTVSGLGAAVQAGDMIYRIDTGTYAKITSVSGSDLTLDTQIFDLNTTSRYFIVYRWTAVTFAWDESNNIRGRSVSMADGSLVYPSATLTDSFIITDIAANAQNPYIITSIAGDAIVVYETAGAGSTWDIRTKKIRSDGTFVWSSALANAYNVAGIQVITTAVTPVGSNYLVKNVISDGAGGCWVLYETSSNVIGIAHINSAGTIAGTTVPSADNGRIAAISTTEVILVYETGQPKVIYAKKFNTSATCTGTTQVSPGTVSCSQLNPRVYADGSGGAIVSWLDMRYFPSVYYSIYTQHLLSNLSRVTPVYSAADVFAGIPVRTDQSVSPYAIDHWMLRWSDGGTYNDGVYFWTDQRNSNTDIYFQNITDTN